MTSGDRGFFSEVLHTRISRFLAMAGVASRRRIDSLIEQGRVTVNGRVATLGQQVTPGEDVLRVDGAIVSQKEPPVYLLLNKPSGYLSSCSDPFSRKTVMDLVCGLKARVFPVGRLDLDSQGLLLLTNDGDLAHLLSHPRHRVVKEYIVTVTGLRDESKIRRILAGITIDGKKVRADYAEILEPAVDSACEFRIRIGVHEGQKHLVKRICARVGYKVQKLVRTKVGTLSLGSLASGKWRYLSDREVKSLYRCAGSTRGCTPLAGRPGRPKNDTVDSVKDSPQRHHPKKTCKHGKESGVEAGFRKHYRRGQSLRHAVEKGTSDCR